MPAPAYRIHTPRLVIRCLEPSEAPLLAEVITASLDHLRPWMPWASAPEELEGIIPWLRAFRAAFDTDQDYIYGILTPDESEVIGRIGMHQGIGEGAREIGYWIGVGHAGRGYATEATAALTRVGFEVNGLERLEIRCDPGNGPSAAVPRKLGYTLDATLPGRVRGVDGAMRDTMFWSLLRDEYPASPSAAAQLEAFDAAGRRLP